MSTITVHYTWSIPDTFDINFNWKVVAETTVTNFPTLLTSGPQNAIVRPTIIYPNGGEDILTREIEISWIENFPPTTDGTQIWYEVFFSENYDYVTEPDWKMIAAVPSGIGKYNWRVGNNIKSKNVRCAVRGVNSRGERSDLSISAASFAIRKSLPYTPVVLSPTPNSRYGNTVKFVFDDSAILNTFSQRAKYSIYFSSSKAGIPFTPIIQNVPVGLGPIVWDTVLTPASDDYVLTVYLMDDDGNKSEEVNISNVAILHDNFFVIDTKPPTGYVQINNAAQYTKDLNVSVKLYAYDESTGIHAMQFIESDQQTVTGAPDSYANMKYWTLTDVDGVKTIKVKFQDFGGNRTSDSTKSFRVLFDLNNADIADIVIQKSTSDIWMAVNGDSTTIYKFSPNSSFITGINEEVNVLSIYDDVLYASVKTSDSTALVYRWTGFLLEEVFALTETDSEIISMFEYKGNLYCGSKNGTLSVYNKKTVTSIKTFPSQVYRLYSDDNLLYIILQNSKTIFVYDEKTFVEVTV